MPGSCRPPSPSLAPVLLAMLLGGEWGPCLPNCPPVPHPHCPGGESEAGSGSGWEPQEEGRRKGGGWVCFPICEVGKT